MFVYYTQFCLSVCHMLCRWAWLFH